jgi:hypothetical protein
VDASDDKGLATFEIIDEYKKDLGIEVILSRTKGIPHQRNLGLTPNQKGVVHFLDDDIELSGDYFREIEQGFVDFRDLVGVCGLITNTEKRRFSLFSRVFLLSPKPGRISPAGHNSWITEDDVHDDFQLVDWLTGPCMSYNFDRVGALRFDERFPGYALGEDMRFSFECSKFGKLAISKKATLKHFEMNTEKTKLAEFIQCKWSHLRIFVVENPNRFSFTLFKWSFYGSFLIFFIKFIVKRISGAEFKAIFLATRKLIGDGINSRQPLVICKCRG